MKVAVAAMAALALIAVGCSRDVGPTGGAPAPDTPATDTPAGTGGPVGASAPGTGGTDTPPAGQTPGTAPEPSGSVAPAGSVRCHTSELTATLRQEGAATGNRYATLVLTNHTSRTCRIYGYGGLALLDAHHRAVPTHQHRDPAHPPTLITVAPGHSVSAALHWGVVPSGSEPEQGPCEPTPAFLSVIPPDETDALLVDWSAGPVCQQGRIDQWAYQSGIVTR